MVCSPTGMVSAVLTPMSVVLGWAMFTPPLCEPVANPDDGLRMPPAARRRRDLLPVQLRGDRERGQVGQLVEHRLGNGHPKAKCHRTKQMQNQADALSQLSNEELLQSLVEEARAIGLDVRATELRIGPTRRGPRLVNGG
jgi:hypothetical protein